MKPKQRSIDTPKSIVSFEIIYEEDDKIDFVNPKIEQEGVPINLFNAIIAQLSEIKKQYNEGK